MPQIDFNKKVCEILSKCYNNCDNCPYKDIESIDECQSRLLADILLKERRQEEEYDNTIYEQYKLGFMDGTKETATEIITHLKRRQLVDKYELQKMAEKYGVELKE